MGKSGEGSAAAGREESLPSLLRDYGDAIEAACPPFDAAASAARLRDEARARGLLRPEDPPAADIIATGIALEEQAPPFDVEVGAARLREVASSRGLLSSMELGVSDEATSEAGKRERGTPQLMEAKTPGQGVLLNGRYQLERILGEDGMGRVWLAEDLLLERRVALKELVHHRSVADADVDRRRALQEARALARVQHPAMANIHDVIFDHEDPWVVMEYVSGRTLSEIIARGPLEERAVAAIGLQVANGLAAAHEAGVVHRDVKPGNILVTNDSSVFLVDFGIAKGPEGRPLTDPGGAVVGTLEFLAPERFMPNHDDGPAADLWSLGVTLYYALEGRSPFKRADRNATMLAIMHEAPPAPARPGELAEAVLRLLDKNPDRRLMVRELAEVLRPLLVEPREREPIPRPDPRPLATTLQAPRPGRRWLTAHQVQEHREAIRRIGPHAGANLLMSMPEDHAAEVLSGYSSPVAAELITAIAAIRPTVAASILQRRAVQVLPHLRSSSAESILGSIPVDHVSMILNRLDARIASRMLAGFPRQMAAKVVGKMDVPQAAEMLRYITPRTAAELIVNIESKNARARLLRQLDPSFREQVQSQKSS